MAAPGILTPLLLAALALAGCKAKVETKDDDRSGNVHISMGGNDSGAVSIDTPVFKADVKLPGFAFGGDHMDLDGIRMFHGSTVTGVNVDAQGRSGGGDADADADGKGVVRIAFSAPAAPAAVVEHYAKSARDAGWTEVTAAGGAMHATRLKDGEPKRFDLAVRPAAGGSAGAITMTGG